MPETGFGANLGIEETLAENYNISLGDKIFENKETIGTFTIVSIQISWNNLSGILDGTIKLQQTNDSIIWDDVGLSQTLDSTNNSITLLITEFGGKNIRAVFTKNNIQVGNLTIKLIAKD